MKRNYLVILVSLVCLCVAAPSMALAKDGVIYETSFEKGTGNVPSGWSASPKQGMQWENVGRTGNHSISVSDSTRNGSATWTSEKFALEQGQPYRLSFWTKDEGEGHAIVSGVQGITHTFVFAGNVWAHRSFVFAVPETKETYIKLGQYHIKGKVYFDDVRLEKLEPVYQQENGIVLAEGEKIENKTYHFDAPFTSNFSQNLVHNIAGFNTNRWVFQQNSNVVYKHQVNGVMQQSAVVVARVNWYKSGTLLIEVSNDDGKRWTELGTLTGKGTIKKNVPASLFPAKSIEVRLRAVGASNSVKINDPGSFQVNNYQYTAQLSEKVDAAQGKTRFLTQTEINPNVQVQVKSLGDLIPGPNIVRLSVSGASSPLEGKVTFLQEKSEPLVFRSSSKTQGANQVLTIPYDFKKTGRWQIKIDVSEDNKGVYSASTDFYIPSLYDIDYGKRITNNDDLWWCGPVHKVWQDRDLPPASDKSTFVPLSLARNEYEAVQIVVKPQTDISNVMVKVTDLTGPNGAKIGSSHITVDEVVYVPISEPTDFMGSQDNWPDPLPPLTNPITLKANQNQPFWITVFAPKDIPAGTYTGKVLLSGENWSREVPLQVKVWNFTLSDETHIKTAFGMNAWQVGKYHHISGDELTQVVNKYFDNYAQHRVSPYLRSNYMNFKVDWGFKKTSFTQVSGWDGGTLDTINPYNGKRSLRIDNENAYHSSANYWRHIPVMGGKNYKFQYAVRSAGEGQKYQIHLATYDSDNKPLSQNDIKISNAATAKWQQVEIDLSKELTKPDIRFVKVSVSTTRDKSQKASVWFDEMQLIENGKTDLLNTDGDFEKERAHITADQVKVDFSDFDKMMERRIDQDHATTFRVRIRYYGTGGKNSNGDYRPGRIGEFTQGSEQYDILFGSMLKQVQDHLEEKGWLDKAYIYWVDEPTSGQYEGIVDMSKIIRTHAPKLKWMVPLTNMPGSALLKAVDISNPVVRRFSYQVADEVRSYGKELWWYLANNNAISDNAYVSEYIDHPAVESRLWPWQSWKDNVSGMLVWDVNYWTDEKGGNPVYHGALQNPWEDAKSYAPGGDSWGNGEGRYLYPPRRDANKDKTPDLNGPINSIRWDLFRDGIEDYEYFWTLQQQVNRISQKTNRSKIEEEWLSAAKVLLQIPESVIVGLTQYSKDPAALMQHRTKIAQAIEQGNQFK